MALSQSARYRLLRVALLFSAVAWGVSVYGVFASWDAAHQALQGLGAKPITYDPMLDYWLRMTAGAFAIIGFGYLLLAIEPRKYISVLRWAGWLMVIEGIILAVHGFRLNLPPFPFYGDIAACFVGGGAILALYKSALR